MPRGSRRGLSLMFPLWEIDRTEYSRDGPAVVATPALRHDDEDGDRMDQLRNAV